MTPVTPERGLHGEPVEALLLDLYDTLAWTPREVLEREPIVLRTGIDVETLKRAWLSTYDARATGALDSLEEELAEILRECGVLPRPELLAELAELEYATWREGVRVFGDSLPFLDRARERGVRTAIVSNCSRQTREVVPAIGLDRAVDEVVLSFEVGVRKPDAGIYRAALDRLAVEPARAVFVDDIVEYLDGARALGIRTVQIVRDGWERESGNGHPKVSELAELEALLEG